MFKKSTLAFATGLSCLSISHLCFATTVNGQSPITPPSVSSIVPVESVIESTLPICAANYGFPYIRAGISAYNLRNPTVDIGTAGNTTAHLAEIDNHGVIPMFHAAIGYAFDNPSNSIITKIFGHDNAVEFRGSYFNTNETRKRDHLGTGKIWYIDGTKEVFGSTTVDLYNFKLKSEHRYIDTGAFFRGGWVTSNSKLTVKPRAGFIYTNYVGDYNFSVLVGGGGGGTDSDIEKYKVKTNYVGVAGGGMLTYHASNRIAIFGDLEAQLLHAHSSLDATQQASSMSKDYKKVHATKRIAVTYRTIVAAGIQIAINKQINSPTIAIKGGVDRWGYDPQVVPPNNKSSKAIHLEGTTQNNLFATLEVTVPLG